MTTSAPQARSSRSPSPLAGCHCPGAEYAALIRGQPLSAEWRKKHLNFHRRFVRTYPELAAWSGLPLRERLGWRGPEAQDQRRGPDDGFDPTAGWITFNARHYLTYLALTGRLRLDWAWLLGIGVLKPWLVADQIGLPLSIQAASLRERLIALGHVRDEESFRLSWALIRLVLHRGDPDLTAITADDVEEMRQVIKHIDQVPGIGEVIDPARLPGMKAAWGTNAYRAGLALFHGGITDRLPLPYRGLPRPPLSSKPRIAAVMDRFVAERALVLRPDTMSSLRGGLRRFGLWLDTERPHIDSLAQLTRADLVDFMESVHQMRKIKHPGQTISPAFRAGIISTIAVFVRYAALFEWDDVPARPLITHADMPRRIQRVPRFIPGHQLDPVMERIRALECPLQRCAADRPVERRPPPRSASSRSTASTPTPTARPGCAWPPARRCGNAPCPCTKRPHSPSATWPGCAKPSPTRGSSTPTWDARCATCSCATASWPTPTACSPARSPRSARNWRSSTATASPPCTPIGSAIPSAPSWPKKAPGRRPS